MYGPPVDVSFTAIRKVTDLLRVAPRRGLRPLKTNSKGKYLSSSFRATNNNISDPEGLLRIIDHFLAEPRKICWLDLSFNRLKCIPSLLKELPELRVLYLHSNAISDLSEVDRLKELQYLHTFTLHGNVMVANRSYRNHVITALPQLKTMDFSAVTREERVLANIWRQSSNRGKSTEKSPQ